MSTAETRLYTRRELADHILARLDDETHAEAKRQFANNGDTPWFMVDALLPEEMAIAIYGAFPEPSEMRERRTLREHKFVAAQMNRYAPQAEEALFAFQDERVIDRVARITDLMALEADPKLYAGGISVMARGNFLNPHLDNSHDNDRKRFRVLNLLYYVSPDWHRNCGGHLELWPQGLSNPPTVIESAFNRLVVMATGPSSWHSVNRVDSERKRCCVSNYYFSEQPIAGDHSRRVTTFRGRPEQPLRDLVLKVDGALRQLVRKIRPQGVVKTTHMYDREEQR